MLVFAQLKTKTNQKTVQTGVQVSAFSEFWHILFELEGLDSTGHDIVCENAHRPVGRLLVPPVPTSATASFSFLYVSDDECDERRQPGNDGRFKVHPITEFTIPGFSASMVQPRSFQGKINPKGRRPQSPGLIWLQSKFGSY